MLNKNLDLFLKTITEIRTECKSKPVIIGVRGPQGCGKSTLSRLACKELCQQGLRADFISIDDYYLSYVEQCRLYEQSQNPIYEFRGNPGTHDLELLRAHLERIKFANCANVELPIYDKLVKNGAGDRIGSRGLVLPLDVLILEGWMVGFRPLDKQAPANLEATRKILDAALLPYQDLWEMIDRYIVMQVQNLEVIYGWRWEQEVNACRELGIKCPTRPQIDCFVDRFMPAYQIYGRQATLPSTILLDLDINRELKRVQG